MNKIITISITAVVVIVCLGGMLIPILDDATETHKSFTNTGLYYMTDDADNIEYELSSGTWSVDGEALNFSGTSTNPMLVANSVFIMNNGKSAGASPAFTWASASVTADGDTITGNAVVSGSSTAVSLDCSDTFYGVTNKTDDLVFVNASTDNYVLKTGTINSYGLMDVTGSNGYVPYYITINNGVATITSIDSVTISNIVVDWDAVDGYEDLYKLSGVTFDTVYNDTTISQTVGNFIIPTEVSAEITGHLSSNQIALLDVIPVMIIVALIMSIVAAVLIKRFG